VLLKRSEYLYQTALKTLRRQHRAAHPGAAEAAGARPAHQITYVSDIGGDLGGQRSCGEAGERDG